MFTSNESHRNKLLPLFDARPNYSLLVHEGMSLFTALLLWERRHLNGKSIRGQWWRSFQKSVEIPPTAVGGLFRSGLSQTPLLSTLCRLDLNHPPTAVGGIQEMRRDHS
jgi:hypothetical protein